MEIHNHLYQPYEASGKYADVFVNIIPPGPHIITLRPFYIQDDFHLYNEWIKDEIASEINRPFSVPVFSSAYFKALLESSNAQALWGMIDGKPAFALDLFEAIGFHLPDHIKGLELKSGDVMLQLIIDPQLLREGHPAVDYILPACLTYIATYVHPRRVLWIIDRNNQFYNRLASNAEPSFELKYDRIKQVFGYNLVSNS